MDVYLPDNVDLRGDCDEDYSTLSMTFKAFELKIFFRKVRFVDLNWGNTDF